MSRICRTLIPASGFALVALGLGTSLHAQSPAGQMDSLQNTMIDLKSRVAKLEDSSSNGCQLDPKKMLKVKCPNSTLQVGGRIMLDAAWFTHDEIGGDPGHEFRRARLFASGSFAKTWSWKSQFDFAGNKVSTKDLFIQYNGLKKSFEGLYIRVGHYKVPYSLQNLTSSKYISFMERSQSNDFLSTLGADRKTGIGFMFGGAHYSAAGGLFYGGAEKSAFKNGASIAGRVTYAPIAEKTRVVHVGGGILYRNNFKENELRLRARPEIHLANRAIDTGTIEGVDGATSYNAELAGVYGPYSVQGEYFRSSLNRSKDAKTLHLNSYYVEATWWLTGESRNYAAAKGAFGRVKPKKNVSDGGPGAWMLGYRFSRATLKDADINGGSHNVNTLGLTWKPNPYVALKINGEFVNGRDKDGEKINDKGVQGRLQVDF